LKELGQLVHDRRKYRKRFEVIKGNLSFEINRRVKKQMKKFAGEEIRPLI
jgi:hypothetical protein